MKSYLFLLLALLYAASADAVYYVGPSGSDGNSCAQIQSSGTPARQVARAADCVSQSGSGAGKEIRVFAGTYTPIQISAALYPNANGSAGGGYLLVRPNPGDVVNIVGNENSVGVDYIQVGESGNGFHFSGRGDMSFGGPDGATLKTHIRIVGNEFDGGSTLGGYVFTAHTIDSELSWNHIHDVDELFQNGSHCLYVTGITDRMLIEHNFIQNCNMVNNGGGWGMTITSNHQCPPTCPGDVVTNITVRYNVVDRTSGPGIGCSGVFPCFVYNNIITGSPSGFGGLFVSGTGAFYNNTIYGNAIAATYDRNTGQVWRNNLTQGNTSNGIYERNQLSPNGIFSHNMCPSPAEGCQIPTTSTHFVNAPAGDFNLIASSPARDNGTTQIRGTTGGACPNSQVASGADITITVFQNQCPDIGALEFGGAPNLPPTITLTSPTNPFSTGAATQTISGTASDSDGSVASVTYTCNRCGAASGPGSGTAGGTPTNWTIPNAPLHAGIQTFSMTATDNLGMPSPTITLTITHTPTFPGNALVAAWAFNDSPGTTADDSSGNNNTGLLINGATFSASGHSQGALSLNGSNQYASVADSNSLDLTQGFTFSAWVMPTGIHTDFRSLFAKEGPNDHVQFLFASSSGFCTSGGVLLGAQTNGVSGPQIWNCYSATIPVGIWTHVAGTYNGTTLTIYINGAVAGTPTSVTGLMEPSSLPLRIGGSQYGEFFQGLIDEARIYNWAIPRIAASNTVPSAACVFGNPLDTAQQSIVRDMNCPVIAAVPPLPIKFPAAPSGLKLGAAAAGAKFGH